MNINSMNYRAAMDLPDLFLECDNDTINRLNVQSLYR